MHTAAPMKPETIAEWWKDRNGKPETVRFSGTAVCPACHGSGRALAAGRGA